jgi:hypothetical protein
MNRHIARPILAALADVAKIIGVATAIMLIICLLSGCAQSPRPDKPKPVYVDRPIATPCLARRDADKIKALRPAKVGADLNGDAIHDDLILASKAMRFEAWADLVIAALDGCAVRP